MQIWTSWTIVLYILFSVRACFFLTDISVFSEKILLKILLILLMSLEIFANFFISPKLEERKKKKPLLSCCQMQVTRCVDAILDIYFSLISITFGGKPFFLLQVLLLDLKWRAQSIKYYCLSNHLLVSNLRGWSADSKIRDTFFY